MQAKSSNKILKFFIITVLILFVVIQLYRSLYNPISTGTVVSYTTQNGIDLEVTAIRDESLLSADSSGVISYHVADGEKVKSGGTVAKMYLSEQDANIKTQIESLKTIINDLEEVEGYNSNEAVDIDVLNEKINTTLCSLINEVNNGKIGNEQHSSALLKLLNRRQIATGISKGFSSLLKEYKAELKLLKAKSTSAVGSVETDTSGYFSSSVDGFEGVLKPKDIKKLTPERLKSIKREDVNSSGGKKNIGKIVSDYVWYLAAEISLDDSLKLKPDDRYNLLTDFESIPSLPVTVKCINKSTSGNKAVVVFACDYINSDLATMRTKEMKLVLETFTGLQVNSKAIRFVNGKKGVYVVSGSVLKFVPVDVVYSSENYSICRSFTTGNRLRLYDEVVIKGKNLYDGKVIS